MRERQKDNKKSEENNCTKNTDRTMQSSYDAAMTLKDTSDVLLVFLSHEKTKTNNVSVRLSMCSDFPTPSSQVKSILFQIQLYWY